VESDMAMDDSDEDADEDDGLGERMERLIVCS
jgi:hypothetical protein